VWVRSKRLPRNHGPITITIAYAMMDASPGEDGGGEVLLASGRESRDLRNGGRAPASVGQCWRELNDHGRRHCGQGRYQTGPYGWEIVRADRPRARRTCWKWRARTAEETGLHAAPWSRMGEVDAITAF